MKNIVLALIVMLCSSQAFAMGGKSQSIDENSSWEQIMNAGGVLADFQKIQILNTFFPVISLCVDGDNLRSIHKSERCVAWESRGDSYECSKSVEEFFSTPRAHSREVCVEYKAGESSECARYETYTYVHPVSYDVPVYSVQGSGEGETRSFLFNKRLDLAACAN